MAGGWRMGLAEKRAIKEFQDTIYPGLTKELHDVCGFAVDIEIQWETVTQDGMGHMFNESLTKVYFQPVIEAMKEICVDDMGREALKDGLKKLVFCNTKGTYLASEAISFEGGVLQVDHEPYSNLNHLDERRKRIVELVSSAL